MQGGLVTQYHTNSQILTNRGIVHSRNLENA